jgi:hypothetical protein
MDDYATHLPILECIANNIVCDNVFEFGMGNYSTKLFAQKFNSVTSIEMQEHNWYLIMQEQNLPSNVDLRSAVGQTPAIDILNSMNTRFSMIFVDGHGDNRWQCINESFAKTDIIVTHDTETPGYNWHLIEKPENFTWIDIKQYNPWTSVLTCNNDVISFVTQAFPSYTIR